MAALVYRRTSFKPRAAALKHQQSDETAALLGYPGAPGACDQRVVGGHGRGTTADPGDRKLSDDDRLERRTRLQAL